MISITDVAKEFCDQGCGFAFISVARDHRHQNLRVFMRLLRKGRVMNTDIRPFNMMEQVVDFSLMELMQKSKMCTCERCCADVRAIVLNSLPPKYVVTRVGEAMLQFELLTPQMQAAVVSEIMIAIEKVNRNPRHSSSD